MKLHHRLKHAFIPHKHNDYKPHFFREFSISLLLITNLALFAVSGSSALVVKNTDFGAHIIVNVLIDLTNDNRLQNNLTALIHNPLLDTAAQLKAEDMVRNGYFAHYSPTGTTPWHWFSEVGYYFLYAGENLAVNFTESVDVENAWMKSPLHRANILDTKFKEIGLATSNGIYEGNGTTFVVQLFGTPSFAASPKVVAVESDVTSTTTEELVEATSSKEQVLGSSVSQVKEIQTKKKPAALGETFKEVKQEPQNNLIAINDSSSITAVQNTDADTTVVPTTQEVPKYSTWYERFIYSSPIRVSAVYMVFIVFILIAFSLMVFIEIKRQHPKNIFYGVLILVVIFFLMYVNQEYFVKGIPFV